jgi:hypothetical protein
MINDLEPKVLIVEPEFAGSGRDGREIQIKYFVSLRGQNCQAKSMN